MVEAVQRTYKVRRGDAWVGESFRLISTVAGFWSGAKAKSQIRKTENGPVIHEFSLNPVVTQEGANTVLTLSISFSPEDSAKLVPGTYLGDVEVSSTQLPKCTPIEFTIDANGDITRTTNA